MAELLQIVSQALAAQELTQLSGNGLTASFAGWPTLDEFRATEYPFTCGVMNNVNPDLGGAMGRGSTPHPRTYHLDRYIVLGGVSDNALPTLETEARTKWADPYIKAIYAHVTLGGVCQDAKPSMGRFTFTNLYGEQHYAIHFTVLIDAEDIIVVGP